MAPLLNLSRARDSTRNEQMPKVITVRLEGNENKKRV
jgi:hypothetical protein